MGILGNLNLSRRSLQVLVGTDSKGNRVELTVYPPGLGVIDKLVAQIPEVVAPLSKDSKGRTVKVKDDEGNPITDQATGQPLLARNYKNPAYLTAIETRDKACTIAMILECLGDALTPSKDVEDFDGDWQAYYLWAWSAIEAEGLDIGSYRSLSAACTKLSLPLGEADVTLAREALALDDKSQDEIKAEAIKDGIGKLEGKSE